MTARSAKRITAILLGLVLVGGAGTFLVARNTAGHRMPPATQARAVEPAPAPAPADDMVEFRDDQSGFALTYPKAWVRPTSSNPQIPLVVAEQDPARNQGGSILVRVTPLDAPVAKDQLAEARKATDAIINASPDVTLKAEPTQTEQGGLPGLYYLYTFRDPVSGQPGVHSHFFFFKDKSMISLVFQALPQADFARLAPLFDRVTSSLRAL